MFEPNYPCVVESKGTIQAEHCVWRRTLNGPGSRTTFGEAKKVKQIAATADAAVRRGEQVLLPLISYFGTGRLWQEPKDSFQVADPEQLTGKADLSRFTGYWNSVDPRLSVVDLTRWIARQTWAAFQNKGKTTPLFDAVKAAMIGCIPGAQDMYFDPNVGEVIVRLENKSQPFSNLSDGQRSMLAMVGDLAQKAARLNPHLGRQVLQETTGVVLIDELDLHLHPNWQKQIIRDLTAAFPRIQFICTTHSPFIIQSLVEGTIIRLYDGNVDDAPEQCNMYAVEAEMPNPIAEPQVLENRMKCENLEPMLNSSVEDIAEERLNAHPDVGNGYVKPTDKDDRWLHRRQNWEKAIRRRDELALLDTSAEREKIVEYALERGLFSIWMTVFANDADMKVRFIAAFVGTDQRCFNAQGNAVRHPTGQI